jgi:type II secretory pathway component PulC
VESGGKVVENPSNDLLKRVRIRTTDIVKVFGTKTAPKIPALSVVRAYDGRSKVMGLEVASKTSVSDALGLNVGDIVTAIGSKMVRSPNDLKSFAVLFHDSNELGFSYERGGLVRKTILYRTE